jgi:hypothetical protein
MLWCGPLRLAFPCDVPYACTNIQQVAYEKEEEEEEEEEEEAHIHMAQCKGVR